MINFNLMYMLILIPMILIVSGALAILHRKKESAFIVQVVLLIMNLIFAILFFVTGGQTIAFSVFTIYSFSALFIGLFSLLFLLIIILTYKHSMKFNYVSLLISMVYFGAIAVSTSTSLIITIIGIEMVSIGSIFMVLFEKRDSIEAAIKLFILSGSAIAILTVALALIIPYDSTFAITAIISSGPLNYILLFSLLLFGVGLLFEVGAFPFNLWIPDIYEEVQGNITAMLSGINKKVAFVAIIVVFGIVFVRYWYIFSEFFSIIAIFTMFFGNIMALIQTNIKRMFAYSAISQSGYILIGIATASQFGFEASIFQIIAHSFMIIGTFAIVMLLEFRNIKTLNDYSGLMYRNGFLGFSLTIFILSMIGIPGLMGFYGKFLLFASAINANIVILAIMGLINSVISVYYYGRIISIIFKSSNKNKIFIDKYSYFVILVALSFIIVFGIYPTPLIIASQLASSSLLLL